MRSAGQHFKTKETEGHHSCLIKVQPSGMLPGDLFSKLNPTGFDIGIFIRVHPTN